MNDLCKDLCQIRAPSLVPETRIWIKLSEATIQPTEGWKQGTAEVLIGDPGQTMEHGGILPVTKMLSGTDLQKAAPEDRVYICITMCQVAQSEWGKTTRVF